MWDHRRGNVDVTVSNVKFLGAKRITGRCRHSGWRKMRQTQWYWCGGDGEREGRWERERKRERGQLSAASSHFPRLHRFWGSNSCPSACIASTFLTHWAILLVLKKEKKTRQLNILLLIHCRNSFVPMCWIQYGNIPFEAFGTEIEKPAMTVSRAQKKIRNKDRRH